MKAASIKLIKDELKYRSQEELIEICLQLARFKKENKELLSYILYDSENEAIFINDLKEEITEDFKLINTNSYFYIKKSVRKILRNIKKHIRYSKKKETEVELLIHFCTELKNIKPTIKENTTLHNIFKKQIENIKKTIAKLHEDLQYDYTEEIKLLEQ